MAIRVLPADVVNSIAAGEVIERPASVVKELVENAIDAGATKVDIEVRDGGKSLIRVQDDGGGMSGADLEVVFLPHSTSKLEDVEDLMHIGTLGFRGEALASIGAVARARIVSRLRGETGGHEVTDAFGEIGQVRPAAALEGTSIEVSDLFRNVPVRSKFLKSTGAEMAQITQAVHRFGISTPEVEFRLTHGGRSVSDFTAGTGRRERIARAYGRELVDELIEARAAAEGIHLDALIAPPSRTFSDSTRMLFFLNGRHVRDKTLLHAARHAYEDLIFGPRSPMVFVFLSMDPGIVDQNVHPAKLEVRFRNSGTVHSLVSRTLREALMRTELPHPVRLPTEDRRERIREAIADYLDRERGDAGASAPAPSLFDAGPPGGGRDRSGGDVGRALDFLQVKDCYIVLESEDGISVVDQHALHERVLFDRIKARYLAGEVEVQRLLRPVVVELTAVEVEALIGEQEALRSIGVEIERFGPDSVAVQGLPAAAGEADPVSVVEGILGGLAKDRPPSREEVVDRLISTLACHSAVKAGDRLGRQEITDLLAAAERLEHSQTCPHGRPTMLSLSYGALERHFKRS